MEALKAVFLVDDTNCSVCYFFIFLHAHQQFELQGHSFTDSQIGYMQLVLYQFHYSHKDLQNMVLSDVTI